MLPLTAITLKDLRGMSYLLEKNTTLKINILKSTSDENIEIRVAPEDIDDRRRSSTSNTCQNC